MMKIRKLLAYLALGTATLAACVVVGDWALRRAEWHAAGVSGDLRFGEGDPRLGWRTTPNYSVEYHRRTVDGVDHVVAYSSVTDGFRLYGDANSRRQKLLIIGDSFTHAVNVSTNRTYGALLSDSLNLEVFSYGAGGFGTLQELLVLQDVVARIKPDIVLLQFCSNDFVNNSYEMESRSTINNNRTVRPYETSEGRIVYRNPFFRSEYVASKLNGSRVFRLIANQFLFATRQSIESKIAANPEDPVMAASVTVTTALIGRMRKTLAPNTPMYVFTADDGRTRFRSFPDVEGVARFSDIAERRLVEIAKLTGVTYLPGIATAVANAENNGEIVKDIDGAHWSERGHAIVAAQLVSRLRSVVSEGAKQSSGAMESLPTNP